MLLMYEIIPLAALSLQMWSYPRDRISLTTGAKVLKLTIVILLISLVVGNVSVQAQANDLQAQLNAAVEAGGFAGILVHIADGGDTEILSAGAADVLEGTPIQGNEHFRIGSVTKLFTATAVLQIVGEGRLALDDTVQQILPDVLPSDLPAITVQQLLEHTSGLNDYEGVLGFDNTAAVIDQRSRVWSRDELIAFGLEQPRVGEPGSVWSYSSTNYILLGAVIEAVTGEPYARYIEENILQPLNMTETSFPGTDETLPQPYLHGYTPSTTSVEGLVDISYWNPSVAEAAGEMISTAADLDRFIAALLGGELLDEAEQEALLRAASVLPEGLPEGMGAGMGVSFMPTSCGKVIYGGGGAVPGYITSLFATRDGEQRAVITFTLKTTMANANQITIAQITDAAFCSA
jgi:D-alanyl-D-alanine carboxypeptidase